MKCFIIGLILSIPYTIQENQPKENELYIQTIKKACEYVEKRVDKAGKLKEKVWKDQKGETAGVEAIVALALLQSEASHRIIERFAKDGPKAIEYPGDFSMAFISLAVIEAYRQEPEKY